MQIFQFLLILLVFLVEFIIISRFLYIFMLVFFKHQPSICFPRKSAAITATFRSVSDKLCRPSLFRTTTAPMASPWHMMVWMIWPSYFSSFSPVMWIYFFSPFFAIMASRSLIASSRSLCKDFPNKSLFGAPDTAIIWSRSVIQIGNPIVFAVASTYSCANVLSSPMGEYFLKRKILLSF